MPALSYVHRARDARARLTPAQQRVIALSQWMTDPWVAKLIADVAEVRNKRVLEPSAGRGALVDAALAGGAQYVHAVELDGKLARALQQRVKREDLPVGVFRGDFLKFTAPATYDVATANPPYEGGQDLSHVLHMLKLAEHVVVELRLSALAGVLRHDALWSRFDVRQVLVLPQRPDHGAEARRVGMTSDGAQSDFIVVDVLARPRRLGSRPSLEWVRRPAA